ncbi:molybdenum cofactor synthesis domain protein [Desulfofarcimen acetoxidans DSM 771]|uniref:Molybdopterin molybdenumtransferase n=1 Tax=Desulfofarcimen acetoxidans (strain ATCC 49208 / DSM 771 / KCTC 5769 / VKM B-1644 / 5575) TaxID=485916 RepID=C8W6W1_DESAS|nr:gephyrin-like molybdotransferase Glp [Desulfofarcimen acetoxidans]ACV64220.1 molybdenum cofactor synthesis domain protein [Desulfofarcimen acetoxidans DSM 771]
MLQSIPLEKALQILHEFSAPRGIEEIAVAEAFGRILAEDIIAGFPLPPFNRSPLDGYALMAEDTFSAAKDNPVRLKLTQTVYAGELPSAPVIKGETTAITTGAPLPSGTNAIIKFEDIKKDGDYILIFSPLKPGDNFVPAGEDVVEGEKILVIGEKITPASLGLLVSLGRGTVKVFRKPRIAVFSCGDELLDIGQPRQTGKIYNSNLYAITAQITEAGGLAVPIKSVPDDKNKIASALNQALQENDLVITTGGVSVGEKDYVKEAIKISNINTLFWKVGMKPGTPAVCGERDGQLVIGLSGNPAASMITFVLLARPIIQSICGKKGENLPEVKAVMDVPFKKKSGQRRFMRAVLTWKDGIYHAAPAGIQSPGALKSMLQCNALIDIPKGHGPLDIGDEVKALLLPEGYCM